MLFSDVSSTSAAVSATASRTAKSGIVAELFRRAADAELPLVVAWSAGRTVQRKTGVGWAALRDLPAPTSAATWTVLEVGELLEQLAAVAGTGSARARRELLARLFEAATEPEQHLLRGLLSGELRQGAQDGVLVEATVLASGVSATRLRSAITVAANVVDVCVAALRDPAHGLDEFGLVVGRALAPMLAAGLPPGSGVGDAVMSHPDSGWEWKLDGVRLQAHRAGRDVVLFSRTGDDLTARMPAIVEQVLALPGGDLVLDGEALVLDSAARPAAFQVTAAAAAKHSGTVGTPAGSRAAGTPLDGTIAPGQSTPRAMTLVTFDLLHDAGEDLLASPAQARWRALAARLGAAAELANGPGAVRAVPRLRSDDPVAVEQFWRAALDYGHEGLVGKSVDSLYQAGRRGSSWVKLKPRHELDLVVLAAEWGSGRRKGSLSNLHLGARVGDPVAWPDLSTGAYGPVPERADGIGGHAIGFAMLGKTFKGLTDQVLTWQTEQILARETHRGSYVVFCEPSLVVAIAIDGVQKSPRYPAGMTLRFARVLAYRPDKLASAADDLATLATLAH